MSEQEFLSLYAATTPENLSYLKQEAGKPKWYEVAIPAVTGVLGALFGPANQNPQYYPQPIQRANNTPWIVGGAAFVIVVIVLIFARKK